MKKYYFTFGSNEEFPYQRGWVEIDAPNEQVARAVFQAYFPNKQGNVLNCAFVYTEEQFHNTEMAKGTFPNEFCHAMIHFDGSFPR